MITGFDHITEPLTAYERDTLLPVIVKGLSCKYGQENAVSSKHICTSLKKKGYTITPARLRAIIHHIRVNDLIPLLMANSKGYYRERDMIRIRDYIKSLEQRESSIREVRMAIQRQALEAKQGRLQL